MTATSASWWPSRALARYRKFDSRVSSLLYRPHALRRVVSWRVDERGHLVGAQFFRRKRDEKLTKLSLVRGGIEPPVSCTFG